MNQGGRAPGGAWEPLQRVLLDQGLGHCRGELGSGEKMSSDVIVTTQSRQMTQHHVIWGPRDHSVHPSRTLDPVWGRMLRRGRKRYSCS